jgi:hypothetical protein
MARRSAARSATCAARSEPVARGVTFERRALDRDELGIWSPVPGQGVAWFFDPDGSRLSLSGAI